MVHQQSTTTTAFLLFLLVTTIEIALGQTPNPLKLDKVKGKKPHNVVFILSDDHRYDFMGFMNKVPFLETPNMDKMAKEGVHMANAFVSTSLCSPSRASILTGQYAHRHGVIDNQSPVPDSAVFFPQYLQKAGYKTGFIGKWHMGASHDRPRKGFDYWVSFKGQGKYYNPTLNVNGERVSYTDSSYITDLLTGYALDFLKKQDAKKPFFLYLSHKAVHSEFMPAKRHVNAYNGEAVAYPKTMYHPRRDIDEFNGPPYNYEDLPAWTKEQRYSWHGVDFMYHGAISFETFYRSYCETLLAVDESIGQVLDYLEASGLLENTLVFYMGDNGFSFGEHGLIDKRQAYEESMRVPLLVYGPAMIEQGATVDEVVQNIDIAPTVLELSGLEPPNNMDGKSFAAMLKGQSMAWKDTIFYEYFWERPFPQTPTMHAIRTKRYKYIRYYGVWDINELYDLQNDPEEANNLIRNPEYQELSKKLNDELFDWLESTNGMKIPVKRDQGPRFDYKYKGTY